MNPPPNPLYNGYPLSAYEWWIYVNHFWHLMGDWETIGFKVSEDSFPSDRAAGSVWTISRHQNKVSHLLIFGGQQAYYSLNSCSCPSAFNDICYFISTPNSFLFKFSSGGGEEQGTISAFYIGILTFRLLKCGRDALLWLCFWRVFFPSLLWLALRKLGCQKVKLAVWFKMFRFCLLVTLSPCHKDFHLHILALNIRVSRMSFCYAFIFFYICFNGVLDKDIKSKQMYWNAETDVHEAESRLLFTCRVRSTQLRDIVLTY